MKNTVLIPSIAAVILALTGCAANDGWDRDSKTNPAFQPGATKASVLNGLGQPLSKISTLDGRGECYNYNRNIDGQSVPFYVALNQRGVVVDQNYGLTCSQAAAKGMLIRTEPFKR